MNRKPILIAVLLIVMFGMEIVTALSEISIGVKHGDWVEYDASYTGTPPEGHAATWARMDIEGVEGKRVNVTFTTKLGDGTIENATENLDFETGHLIDYFVIPSGLISGDTFFDEIEGNITISIVEVRAYAGATRTVVSATTLNTLWYWDQSTGALVEAHSSYEGYTLTTIASKTNLWEPQIFGLDSAVFYGLVIVIVVVIAALVVFAVYKKSRGTFPLNQTPRYEHQSYNPEMHFYAKGKLIFRKWN